AAVETDVAARVESDRPVEDALRHRVGVEVVRGTVAAVADLHAVAPEGTGLQTQVAAFHGDVAVGVEVGCAAMMPDSGVASRGEGSGALPGSSGEVDVPGGAAHGDIGPVRGVAVLGADSYILDAGAAVSDGGVSAVVEPGAERYVSLGEHGDV